MPIHTESDTLVMSRKDAAALGEAVRLLEQTSFAARLTNVLGRQIALAGAILPERMRDVVSHAALSALEAALLAALRSLGKEPRPASPRLHKALAATSGAVGGAFGFVLLPLELPISTTLILRSIADLGREEGEDLSQPEAALACLQVFALGGRTSGDEHVDGGYFAVRSLLANAVSESTRYLVAQGASIESAPVLTRLLGQIAARFGMTVSEKLAAQTIPIIGAIGGASVNYAFAAHFQALARGHFIVRRLERTYGADVVRAEYETWRSIAAAA